MKDVQKTNLKYLEVLQDTQKVIDVYNGEVALGKFLRGRGVASQFQSILSKNKIIINRGSSKYPRWEWNSIKPNIKMADRIRVEINDMINPSKRKSIPLKKLNTPTINNVAVKDVVSEAKKENVSNGFYISILWGAIKIKSK